MTTFAKDKFFAEDRIVPLTVMPNKTDFWAQIETGNSFKNYLYEPDTLTYINKKKKPRKIANIVFENFSFSKTEIRNIRFDGCSFRNGILINTKFKNVEFHDCTFEHCNMLGAQFENVYVDPRSFKNCLDPKEHSNIGAKLYHELLINYKAQSQPFFLDTCSYCLSIWRRYSQSHKLKDRCKKLIEAQDWGLKKWLGVLGEYSRILLNYLGQIFFGYGIKISNVFYSSLGFVALFSTINYLCWNDFNMISNGTTGEQSIINAIYYTLISISNLGYGDITPSNNNGKVIASFQAIYGAVWMGTVVGIIVGKIDRFKA